MQPNHSKIIVIAISIKNALREQINFKLILQFNIDRVDSVITLISITTWFLYVGMADRGDNSNINISIGNFDYMY